MSDRVEESRDEWVERVLGLSIARRGLNMKRGRTEKPAFRKSPSGWSERGQKLVDRFDELIAIYDRIEPRVQDLPDDDDAVDDILAHYETLVAGIDQITGTQVEKDPKARDTAIDLVKVHIGIATQVERELDDYDDDKADNVDADPVAVQALLTGGSNAAKRLLEPANKARLEVIVNRLPNTLETVTALEQIEDAILSGPSGFIWKEAHEVFYKKKTDAQEDEAFDKVADSDNPKLGGLKGLPKNKYWTLLMDGRHQGGGNKHFFDQSQGYMASMMKGLNKIIDEIDTPMSVDFVTEMHTCATYQVTEQTANLFFTKTTFQETGLKKTPNEWGMCYDFTDEGLQELQAMRDDMNLVVPGYFKDDEPATVTRRGIAKQVPKAKAADGLRGQSPHLVQAAVKTLMENTIDRYQQDIDDADEVEDEESRNDLKIGAVIDCCRRLGQIHPFKDANGRLMMFLLLNKMLLENGLKPTILDDQGYMIGKGKDELIGLIKAGQLRVDTMRT